MIIIKFSSPTTSFVLSVNNLCTLLTFAVWTLQAYGMTTTLICSVGAATTLLQLLFTIPFICGMLLTATLTSFCSWKTLTITSPVCSGRRLTTLLLWGRMLTLLRSGTVKNWCEHASWADTLVECRLCHGTIATPWALEVATRLYWTTTWGRADTCSLHTWVTSKRCAASLGVLMGRL